MPTSEPFTGFYSKRMRDALPCLSGQELKVFMVIALSAGPEGTAWPGVRMIAELTTYPTTAVSHLLSDLQEKGLVICLRSNGRDPITHQLVPDVYAVDPSLVVVSDPSLWNENRFRNASMPESVLTEEFTQADRITEAESEKLNQQSRITGPEGAAALAQTRVATRNSPTASGKNAGAGSAAGGQRQLNSAARSIQGSAAAGAGRELSFSEKLAVDGVRRKVGDMSHEKAAELVATYGVDQFNAAVLRMLERDKKVPIVRKTGWIIRNLQAGAKA